MTFLTSIILPTDDTEARSTFLDYLADPNRGLLVVLGPDQAVAFGLASSDADTSGDPTVSAIWAQNPSDIAADIAGLFSDSPIFDPANTKVVAINRVKKVMVCLDATDPISASEVLFAYTGAGTTI